MKKGKYKGWVIRGRPFSESEFRQSYIHKNIKGFTYSRYLQRLGILWDDKDFKKEHIEHVKVRKLV